MGNKRSPFRRKLKEIAAKTQNQTTTNSTIGVAPMPDSQAMELSSCSVEYFYDNSRLITATGIGSSYSVENARQTETERENTEVKHNFAGPNNCIEIKENVKSQDIDEFMINIPSGHFPEPVLKCEESIEEIKSRPESDSLDEEYCKAVPWLEKYLPLLRRVADSRVEYRRRASNLIDTVKSRSDEISQMRKQLKTQTDELCEVGARIKAIKEENTELKARQNTFILYKKEVQKYIELIKDAMERRGKDASQLRKENNDLKRLGLQCQFEKDVIMREVDAQKEVIAAMADERIRVEKEQDVIRERIVQIGEDLRCLWGRIGHLTESRYILEAVLGRGTVGMIAGEMPKLCSGIERLKKGLVAMKEFVEMYNNALIEQNKNMGGLEDELDIVKAQLSKAIKDIENANEEKILLIGRNEVLEALVSVESSMRIKIEGLQAAVKAIGKKVLDCQAERMILQMKNYYARLMEGQRKEFEVERRKYEQRINEMRKAGLDDSDVWDIFNGD